MALDIMKLVHEDVQYQVEAGFCEVCTWEDLKQKWPENLKVSPVAVIPQTGRQGRIILDLSFPVFHQAKGKRRRSQQTVLQPSVNETTAQLAPVEAVKDTGKVLPRILMYMAESPTKWPIYFSKIDLSDGYWRMIVPEDQRWNFCYIMPDPPGHPIRIVVPSALQMGWRESPGYFCDATFTVRNIVCDLLEQDVTLGRVELEEHFMPHNELQLAEIVSKIVEVYVDDFILGAQPTSIDHLQKITRAAITAILSVFPSTKQSGHSNGREPISLKKALKGDTRWAIHKVVLGFLWWWSYCSCLSIQ